MDSPILEKIRELLAKQGAPISSDKNAMAAADMVDESSGTVKNYADGGDVDPEDSAPPIGQMMTTLNTTPATDPNIYKGISADDRLAMQQKLIQSQNSPANLVAQGLGGVGDAISNSFGGKNTNFQKGIMENNQRMTDNALSGVDTARAQRLQDFQGNLEVMGSDPNSLLSQSARQMMKAVGVNVASGLPYSVIAKLSPAIGELALKQATLSQQKQFQDATIANQAESRKIEATKALGSQGFFNRLVHPEVTKQLENESGMSGNGSVAVGQTITHPSGAKITRIK